jgi:hypothetical protein
MARVDIGDFYFPEGRPQPIIPPGTTVSQVALKRFAEVYRRYLDTVRELEHITRLFEPTCVMLMEVATGLPATQLGVKSPPELSELVQRRLEAKDFEVEPGQLDFLIKPTQPSGRKIVRWKEVVIELKGLSFVQMKQEQAPPRWNYVAVPVLNHRGEEVA